MSKEAFFSRTWFTQYSHILIIGGITLLGLFIRAGYLLAPYMDSDQAVFALQSMHVLKGEFPVFSWGYAYIGTFQTYIAAVFFVLFGVSRAVFNSTALLFYLVYSAALYVCAKTLFKEFKWQLMAVLLGAVAPGYFLFHGCWGRHGYLETYAFGSVMLAFMCLHCVKPQKLSAFFCVSCIAGLAWWSDFLIIYYGIPFAVFYVYVFVKEPSLKKKAALTGAGAGGFLTGSLPFWVYNLGHGFASFTMFTHEVPAKNFATGLYHFLYTNFPLLVGFRKHVSEGVPFVFFMAAAAVTGLTCIYFLLYGMTAVLRGIHRKRMEPLHVLWLFCIVLGAIFLASGYSRRYFGSNTRYLLPFYSVYPLIVVYFSSTLHKTGRRVSAWLLPVVVLVFNLYCIGVENPIFNEQRRETIAQAVREHRQLASKLRKRGIDRVFMFDYWKAALYTFDALEKVVFAHVKSRYEPYIYETLSRDNAAYLIASKTRSFEKGLKLLNCSYTKESVNGHKLFSQIKPRLSVNVQAMPMRQVRVYNEHNSEMAGLCDGISETYQVISARPEKADSICLKLGSMRKICGCMIILRDKYVVPRAVRVKDGSTGHVLCDVDETLLGFMVGNTPFFPEGPLFFHVFFDSVNTDSLVIVFPQSTRYDFVRVSEIFLFEESEHTVSEANNDFDRFVDKAIASGARVYAGLGGAAYLHERGRKAAYEYPQEIVFDRPSLIIFDRRFAKVNREWLERNDVPYAAAGSADLAAVLTTEPAYVRGLLCDSVLMETIRVDKPKALMYFRKAMKTSDAKPGEKAGYLMKALIEMPRFRAAYKELEYLIKKGEGAAIPIDKWSELDKNGFRGFTASFDKKIALTHVTDPPEEVAPGTIFSIDYYLRFLRRMPNDFALFVHFETPDGRILFNNDHHYEDIDYGRFFVKGEVLEDRQKIVVPLDLDYTGPVTMWMGVWTPDSQRRWDPLSDKEIRHNRVRIADVTIKQNT